jgi:hypothetical protein
MTGVSEAERKLLIMLGGEWDGNGGAKVISIGPRSNFQVQDWDAQVKGCDALRKSAYPGLAYDPVQKQIAGWAGGDTVYLFNPDSKSCSAVKFPNGPGAPQANGTHGRFRYFSKLDVFALVNGAQQDAYILRLRPREESPRSPAKP